MASAHSTSWAEADATNPNRDRALAVSRMVLGSIIRGAVEIRATPPLGAGSLEPLQCPTYHGSSVIGMFQNWSGFAALCYDDQSNWLTWGVHFRARYEQGQSVPETTWRSRVR